jgi:hypothetical protein
MPRRKSKTRPKYRQHKARHSRDHPSWRPLFRPHGSPLFDPGSIRSDRSGEWLFDNRWRQLTFRFCAMDQRTLAYVSLENGSRTCNPMDSAVH